MGAARVWLQNKSSARGRSSTLCIRGLVEPTIAELADGRLMMVMRGSNDADNELPSHKWRALSADGGQNWGAVEPWTYSDGEVDRENGLLIR